MSLRIVDEIIRVTQLAPPSCGEGPHTRPWRRRQRGSVIWPGGRTGVRRPRAARGCSQPPEAGRADVVLSPRAFAARPMPQFPGLWPSEWDRINFCRFKPPNLWSLVYSCPRELGDQHMYAQFLLFPPLTTFIKEK